MGFSYDAGEEAGSAIACFYRGSLVRFFFFPDAFTMRRRWQRVPFSLASVQNGACV